MIRFSTRRAATRVRANGKETWVRVLLIGHPGSGKGTQGHKIADQYGVSYLSSGEVLRAQVAAGTDIGHQVALDLAEGDLVPDDVMLAALREPLSDALTSGGYVLDGFPRKVSQAEELQVYAARLGGAPQAVLWFDVEEAELLRRTRARAAKEGRNDDIDVVARHRIEVYQAATQPLIDYYRSKELLIHLDAAQPVALVADAVNKALAPFAVD
jgi:adenylate kinase